MVRDLDAEPPEGAGSRPDIPQLPTGHGDELDQMIADWNLSAERIQKLLKSKRPRMGAQATAELERLLRKPARVPTPSPQDAIRLLDALLSPKSATPALQAAAAGGEPEPSEPTEEPRAKRKRAR